MTCEDIQVSISGYIDGELTQQETQQVRVHMEACEKCAAVYRELRAVKEKMGQLSYPKSDTEVLERLENELISTTGRWSGWLLILLGFIVFSGFGVYSFITAPDVPGIVRFFYGAFMLGFIVLFITVLRQRLLTYRNDKYRKVKL